MLRKEKMLRKAVPEDIESIQRLIADSVMRLQAAELHGGAARRRAWHRFRR